MRYVNQKEYPHIPYITCTKEDHPQHERGKTTTICTSGCGLCSSIMVADRLLVDYKFELEDAIASRIIESYRDPVTHLKAVGGEDKIELFAL